MCSISSLLLVFIMWTICFMKTHTSFDIYELNQMQNEKKNIWILQRYTSRLYNEVFPPLQLVQIRFK